MSSSVPRQSISSGLSQIYSPNEVGLHTKRSAI